tara:strand:- start:266 stop:700 length:435 start_codon:yes stop_codon:yes gene_type:complete
MGCNCLQGAFAQAANGGATVEIDNAVITSDVTSTATSLTDMAGLVITLASLTDGKTMITATTTIKRSGVGSVEIALADDDSTIVATHVGLEANHAGANYNLCSSYTMDADNSEIQLQARTGGDTLTIEGSNSAPTSNIMSISVG